MSAVNEAASIPLSTSDDAHALRNYWRSLRRVATFIVLLGIPPAFLWLYFGADLSLFWSIFVAMTAAIVVRGGLELAFRRVIPWPSLFGTDDERLREEDALGRRRLYFWSRKARLAL